MERRRPRQHIRRLESGKKIEVNKGVKIGSLDKTKRMYATDLWSRKPENLTDVSRRRYSELSTTQLNLVNALDKKYFENWNMLQQTDLSSKQYWLVELENEEVILLIDTSGFNYPRYVLRIDESD